MSVRLKQIIAIKTVQTLKEVSIVHVLWAIYWMMIGLLVMVCIQSCPYMTGFVKTSLTFQPFFTRSRLDLVLLFLILNLVNCDVFLFLIRHMNYIFIQILMSVA